MTKAGGGGGANSGERALLSSPACMTSWENLVVHCVKQMLLWSDPAGLSYNISHDSWEWNLHIQRYIVEPDAADLQWERVTASV